MVGYKINVGTAKNNLNKDYNVEQYERKNNCTPDYTKKDINREFIE